MFEYFPYENGTHIFPSYIKQIAKVDDEPDTKTSRSRDFVLYTDGHLQISPSKIVIVHASQLDPLSGVKSFFLIENVKHAFSLYLTYFQNSHCVVLSATLPMYWVGYWVLGIG